MPISVRFALRSPKKGARYANPHPLQVWITINRKRIHFGAVWPLQTGEKLTVNPSDWRVDKQDSRRRDDPINQLLPDLKAHIYTVFREQGKTGSPTTDSVYYQLQEGQAPPYDPVSGWQVLPDFETDEEPVIGKDTPFVQVYISRINALKLKYGPSPTRPQEIDIGRWERGLFLLQEWERITGRSVPISSAMTLSWIEDYHDWLKTQKSDKQSKPISGPMASRYIGKIGKVLDWMVRAELLEYNNVKKRSWPRYNDKEIFFLEPEHVEALFALKWKRTKGIALWWFLLMCCTGLDYPDAVAYARNRHEFERVGRSGRKIMGKRMKPPHEEYDVPLLDEVEWLFGVYPEGPKDISGAAVNRYTDQIEEQLHIPWRITKKTGRKTFGCLMLINGYYIGEVSRMLGHKRISTTEKHYAKIIGTAVDRARLRVNKSTLL